MFTWKVFHLKIPLNTLFALGPLQSSSGPPNAPAPALRIISSEENYDFFYHVHEKCIFLSSQDFLHTNILIQSN